MGRGRRLPPSAEKALDLVVDSNVDAVASALRELPLEAPAYAVCLWPYEEEERLDPYPISVGLEPDRRRALASMSQFEAFMWVWNPYEFAIDSLEHHPHVRHRPGFLDAEAEILGVLEMAEVVDPARWVLNRVARRLTEIRPLATATDDFVTFVWDPEFDDDLLEGLREVSTPVIAAALQAKNLLPDDVTKLEGFEHVSGEAE